MVGQPGAQAGVADLPRRGQRRPRPGDGRRPRLARPRADDVRGRQPRRGGQPQQQPGPQPCRAQGRAGHRWRQLRARGEALRQRHGGETPGPQHGRHNRVRGRPGPRGDAGCGRPTHRGVRAHPVHAADAEGPASAAAHRPPDDQQVLRRRPRARTQHGRTLRRLRPAGLHGVLAQPGEAARGLGPGHLRPGRAGRDDRGRGHQQVAEDACCSRCAPAGSSPHSCSAHLVATGQENRLAAFVAAASRCSTSPAPG